MVPEAVAALGGLDVLINNAGIAGPTLPVERMPPAEWDRTVAVNITSMFDVTRLAIPQLKKSKAGSIINMSSIAGRFGFANRSPYAATKWAVIGFTKTLSIELGEWGIRANAIAPGAVEGERLERVFAGRASISGRTTAEERAGRSPSSRSTTPSTPKTSRSLRCFSPATRRSRSRGRCCRSTMTGNARERAFGQTTRVNAVFGQITRVMRGYFFCIIPGAAAVSACSVVVVCG